MSEPVSELQQRLDREISEHNQLHSQIQQGEEQLEAMKKDRDRRVGRIQLLSELLQERQQEEGPKDESPEGASALVAVPDPEDEPEDAK